MTNFTSNIDELIEKFRVIAERASQVDIATALEAGVNAARGKMEFRIFNDGEDSEGNKLGKYVGKKTGLSAKNKKKILGKDENRKFLAGAQKAFSPYEKKRIKAGRQIRYKDFENTGTLRRGIVVLRETEKRVICAIPSAELRTIAKGLEEQTGKILGKGTLKVFAASKSERQVLIDNTTEALKQLYDRILNSE
jgi:hypothetical protein